MLRSLEDEIWCHASSWLHGAFPYLVFLGFPVVVRQWREKSVSLYGGGCGEEDVVVLELLSLTSTIDIQRTTTGLEREFRQRLTMAMVRDDRLGPITFFLLSQPLSDLTICSHMLATSFMVPLGCGSVCGACVPTFLRFGFSFFAVALVVMLSVDVCLSMAALLRIESRVFPLVGLDLFLG